MRIHPSEWQMAPREIASSREEVGLVGGPVVRFRQGAMASQPESLETPDGESDASRDPSRYYPSPNHGHANHGGG